MSKKRFIFTIVLAIVLTFIITSLMYRVTSDNNKENTVEEKQIETEDIKKETDTISKEELKYLRDVEKRFKYNSIIKDGKHIGFGFGVNRNDKVGAVRVLFIEADSPAVKANLKVGDIILKVNNEEVFINTYKDTLAKINNEDGLPVKFTIKRGKKIFNVDIKSEEISVPVVESKVIDSEVGYIKISIFSDQSYKAFDKALEDLLKKDVKSLVLDLRFNPGGRGVDARRIADRLLDNQIITTFEYNNDYKDTFYSDGRSKIDIPFVVLVNNYSASASELVASAIKHNRSALIVGEKTYGKGVSQQAFPLGDGSYCKLTTASFLAPDGSSIHGKGVEPDVNIEEIKAKGYKVTNENDGVLEYAVDFLKGKIK